MHCLAISNSLYSTSGAVFVRLDCEWSAHDGLSSITCLIQISIPNEKLIVANLSSMREFTKELFSTNLRLLLENNNFLFTGRIVKGDCNRLKKLGANIKK